MRITATAAMGSGVAASVGASALFSVVFAMAGVLGALDPFQLLTWRIVIMAAVITGFFTLLRAWGEVRAMARRVRGRPVLAAVVVLDAALFWVQLWLFGWAPQAGRGLEVALGYLLFPLVMVVLGVVLHGERLSAPRAAAVAAAAVGVGAAVLGAGGITWPTLVVALGLPLYFVIRRRTRLDGNGALGLELVAMLPFAVWMLARPSTWEPLAADPGLIGGLALFGLVSGTAFILYFRASAVLPFGLFGLLGYLEPVLLVVVAVTALGERLTPADALVYGPISVALALLAAESPRRARRLAPSPNDAARPVGTGRRRAGGGQDVGAM